MSRRTAKAFLWLALGSPLLVLILLATVALLGSQSPSNFLKQIRASDAHTAVLLSLKTTLISTGIIAIFGTFVALGIARAKPAMASSLELIVTIPAIMPPSVAGLALLLAFGRMGVLGPWLESHGIRLAFTTAAVVMAQVLVSCPFYIREAANAFRAIDEKLIDAARLDGAGPTMLGRQVLLPLAAPFLVTGLVLAWARALSEFGATILFAGNLKGVSQTMPLAIYLGFATDLEQAKALAVLLLLIAVVVLVLVRLVLGRRLKFAH